MRRLWRVLLYAFMVALTFLIFGAGIPASYYVVSSMRIISDDSFFPLGLMLGMLLGVIAVGWYAGWAEPEGAKKFLYPQSVILIMALTPALAALINVKLDFRASRVRYGTIMQESGGRSSKRSLPISHWDNEHTFFWLPLKPEDFEALVNTGTVKFTTRPGLLGFEWIEKVHVPQRYQPSYYPSAPSQPAEKGPVELPPPEAPVEAPLPALEAP